MKMKLADTLGIAIMGTVFLFLFGPTIINSFVDWAKARGRIDRGGNRGGDRRAA